MDKSSPSRKVRKNTVEVSSPSAASEATWKLRIISSDTSSMIVTKDTEKEDRYRATKESWESAQPGRSLRSNEVRESYIKCLENKIIHPIFMTPKAGNDVKYKPWNRINSRPSTTESNIAREPITTQKIPYLNDSGWSRIQSERESKLKAALDEISIIKSNRKNEKEARLSDNKLKDLLSVLSKEFEALHNIDLGKRAEYRSRVLKEADEVAKAIQAAKNSELATGIAEDDKKKKGKK
jgi:hypothetical protein